ncbi:MAG TPA: response regulator [Armatimonadota bacterium]|nr:response regulator [Armatimonadota bacterium]
MTAPPGPVAHGQPGRVLVVDDSAPTRELLRTLLESAGHHVLECGAGEPALRMACEEAPDVVLLDVQMPGIDGFEVCRRLKADPLTAPIPVVLVTGLNDRPAMLEGIAAGATDFVTKPWDNQGLMLRVRNAVHSTHLYRDLEDRSRRLREWEARRLSVLLDVARLINSSLALDAVLDEIIGQGTALLGAQSGSVMLLDTGTRRLRVSAACGPRAAEIQGREQELGQGVAGWVALHGKPLLVRGAAEERFRRVCDRQDLREAICVPLRAEAEVLGVLSVSNRLAPEPFTEADLQLMSALADQAALSLRNARAYAELERQRRTVERLLGELTRAQEQERSRIARQLHDGPAQGMYAALRNAQVLARLIAAGKPSSGEVMGELEQILRQNIAETRAIMIDLNPPSLDTVPLPDALEEYVGRFEQRTGIQARFTQRGPGRELSSTVESCFYPIAQQSLANVWKHSEARHAWVLLDMGARSCSLEIRDDGGGFDMDTAAARAAEHLGMKLLQERAELAGGRLSVETAPGEGTTVRVTVPLADTVDVAEDEES